MQTQSRSGTKLAITMMVTYFITWGVQFICINYVPLYVDALPFTNNTSIGLVMAVTSLVTALSQPIWGQIADRAKTKNRILTITTVGTAAVVWLLILFQPPNMPVLLLMVALLYVFCMVPQALTDTIVVENIQHSSLPFATVRCFSSAGAAFIAFLIFIMSLFTTVTAQTAMLVMSVVAVLSLIPQHFLPQTKGHARDQKKGTSGGLRAVFGNRRLVLLLSFGLCHFICVGCVNAYLGVYVTSEQGLNAGIGFFNLFLTISITGEVLVMYFGRRLLQRISAHTIFLLAPAAGCLRCLVIFFAPSPWFILISSVFHAIMFGPLWARLAPYIRDIVAPEMRATGQSLWTIVHMGFGSVGGSLLGGLITGLLGIHNMFLVVAIMMAVIACVFFVLFGRQERREAREAAEQQPLPVAGEVPAENA